MIKEGHYRNEKGNRNFILTQEPPKVIAGRMYRGLYELVDLEKGTINSLEEDEALYLSVKAIFVTDIEGIYEGYFKEYLRGITNE